MEATWPQGFGPSSGSGAETSAEWPSAWVADEGLNEDDPTSSWACQTEDVSMDEKIDINDSTNSALGAFGDTSLPPGALMSAKVPPAFDGRSSFFQYEELVSDWQDSTTLEGELRGPALKNRLTGEAAVFKPMLDRTKLKDPDL